MSGRTRSLVPAGVATLVAFAILVGLGVWQLKRLAWKDSLIAAVEARSTGQPVDAPSPLRGRALPADWSELAEGLAAPGDIHIVKRQWGAFHGTELDLQLRRREISTVVIGGVATNFGVESTARQAWERGYSVVIAEDACATFTTAMHDFALQWIFPRISRVTNGANIGFVAGRE